MLISYSRISNNANTSFANNIEIVFAPVDEEAQELKWLHMLLEYSYYFIPLGSEDKNTFNMLLGAMSISRRAEDFGEKLPLLRKLFIVKLLKGFGFYPDISRISSFAEFEVSVSTSVDFPNIRAVESLRTILDEISEEEELFISSWIKKCTMRHPNAHCFKSVEV